MIKLIRPLMRLLAALAWLAPVVSTVASEPVNNNNYPILLIHGFTGWGPEEMDGFNYWGGSYDIPALLSSKGYDFRPTAVGPISSNWDRACEFYSFVKGGRVDYGAAHSAEHGHLRFGRRYPGVMPEWGQEGGNGKRKKVHVVTHSMGGQTVRQVVELLYEGSQAEIDFSGYAPGDGPHDLFVGGKKDWVRGVVTLSTPHDGTTLANALDSMTTMNIIFREVLDLLKDISDYGIYDLKLDQWQQLEQHEDESFDDYLDRIVGSEAFDAKDFSFYDLSLEGAREFNRRTSAKDNIYYFSWATHATRPNPISSGQYGSWHLLPPLAPLSLVIGSCLSKCMQSTDDPVLLDESWLPNDGVVNTRSMAGPTLDSQDVIEVWNGKPQVGQWNFMGAKKNWDHMDIIGINNIWPFPKGSQQEDIEHFFVEIARHLQQLPE